MSVYVVFSASPYMRTSPLSSGWSVGRVCRRGRGVWRGLLVCLAPAVFPLPAARWVAPPGCAAPSVAVVGCRFPCLAWVLVAPGVVLSPFLGCVCVLPSFFFNYSMYPRYLKLFTLFFCASCPAFSV